MAKKVYENFSKLIKVKDFLPHSSNGGSLNSSRSYYSLISNSRERLINALKIPNDRFSQYIDSKFTKLSAYMTKLQKEKRKRDYFKEFKKMFKIKRKEKDKRINNEHFNGINLSHQVLLQSGMLLQIYSN